MFMQADTARPDELADAFALIFRHLRDEDRRWRIEKALALIAEGELDARGVFVTRGEAGVTGALVCATVEGAGSLIWPPGVSSACGLAQSQTAKSQSDEDALIPHACAWLRAQGARLTQCLLPPEERPLAASLLRNGFDAITDLLYLEHSLALPAWRWSVPTRLVFTTYRVDQPDEFHRTLERTYEGTLDCPEVNGVRSIDEVMRGHRVQGKYDPARWWLAMHQGIPAGILLLIEQGGGDFDVAYMGLVPEARRLGLGREMLLHALAEAKAAGAQRVTLSVDGRNAPALRLYREVGFREYDRRAVFLRIWR